MSILETCKNFRAVRGAVVCDSADATHTHCAPDDVEFYGGSLVCESVRSPEMANLLAAAPELLESLQAIEMALSCPGVTPLDVLDENSPIRDAIRAAIAKAEGGK